MSTLAPLVQRIARRQSESRLVEKPGQEFEDKATGTKNPGALMAFWPHQRRSTKFAAGRIISMLLDSLPRPRKSDYSRAGGCRQARSSLTQGIGNRVSY